MWLKFESVVYKIPSDCPVKFRVTEEPLVLVCLYDPPYAFTLGILFQPEE